MRTTFFWVITQRVMVISYRRFGKTYRSQIQGPLSMGSVIVNGADMLSRNVGKELVQHGY
jgi:hypothetical protein